MRYIYVSLSIASAERSDDRATSRSRTAEIIPFPLHRVPLEGQERLRRALEELNQALDWQRAAVAGWRAALGELSGVAIGLGGSLRRYRGSLDALAARVGRLNAEALRLERTADAMLAFSPGSPP